MTKAFGTLHPAKLQVGDKVRLVSPASPPNPADVLQAQRKLESWGLDVSLGDNVFRPYGYLAGTDDERLSDLNSALGDPSVRAIVATRGGKGAYCIADQLDFDAARNDPKFVVGFSDITILHMSLWRHSKIVGLHGALYVDDATGSISHRDSETLRAALMEPGPTTITSRADDPTTSGTARGPVLGGNLDMIATGAGWARTAQFSSSKPSRSTSDRWTANSPCCAKQVTLTGLAALQLVSSRSSSPARA
jgi:muramoyltetrapeptide carboxypeptidase